MRVRWVCLVRSCSYWQSRDVLRQWLDRSHRHLASFETSRRLLSSRWSNPSQALSRHSLERHHETHNTAPLPHRAVTAPHRTAPHRKQEHLMKSAHDEQQPSSPSSATIADSKKSDEKTSVPIDHSKLQSMAMLLPTSERISQFADLRSRDKDLASAKRVVYVS